ncbi:hypothetical protein GCM10009682_16230 [Luedemannella flava]|uniref:Uncharacterized protein n=1 Tax=Luedemannella flava TaxID=349316 RepID=A0ABN2LNW3_9ACTN
MTEATRSGTKTLGVRLVDDLHAQLSLVAQIDGMTLTDAILEAIRTFIDRKRQEPSFAERASVALAEIEREAQARRSAVQTLFGGNAPEPAAAEPVEDTGRRRGDRKA